MSIERRTFMATLVASVAGVRGWLAKKTPAPLDDESVPEHPPMPIRRLEAGSGPELVRLLGLEGKHLKQIWITGDNGLPSEAGAIWHINHEAPYCDNPIAELLRQQFSVNNGSAYAAFCCSCCISGPNYETPEQTLDFNIVRLVQAIKGRSRQDIVEGRLRDCLECREWADGPAGEASRSKPKARFSWVGVH